MMHRPNNHGKRPVPIGNCLSRRKPRSATAPSLCGKGPSVPAGLLGEIDGVIGCAEQLVDVLVAMPDRHADAHRRRERRPGKRRDRVDGQSWQMRSPSRATSVGANPAVSTANSSPSIRATVQSVGLGVGDRVADRGGEGAEHVVPCAVRRA